MREMCEEIPTHQIMTFQNNPKGIGNQTNSKIVKCSTKDLNKVEFERRKQRLSAAIARMVADWSVGMRPKSNLKQKHKQAGKRISVDRGQCFEHHGDEARHC
jgi:hypothetical protein